MSKEKKEKLHPVNVRLVEVTRDAPARGAAEQKSAVKIHITPLSEEQETTESEIDIELDQSEASTMINQRKLQKLEQNINSCFSKHLISFLTAIEKFFCV